MAVEFVTGKLGSGKSLYAIRRIQAHLKQGLRVATNLDLYPENLTRYDNTSAPIRIPDRPRLDDLDFLGTGCDAYDEKRFGLLVLDECSHFLNARTWNQKDRAELLNWFTMARKLRWHILFLVQDIDMMDKQVRNALCQYLVVCRDMSSVKLFKVSLPKSHLVLKFFGDTTSSPVVDRHFFRAAELYKGYDTEQVFHEDTLFTESGQAVDMRAIYTQLPAWHVFGRYQRIRNLRQKAYDAVNLAYKACLYALVHTIAVFTPKTPRQIAAGLGLLKPANAASAPRSGGLAA